MIKGNAIVAQSGGPTAVINASLIGVLEGFKRFGKGTLFGAIHAVDGIKKRDFVDLTKTVGVRRGEQIMRTPSAYLGSSRHKPKKADCAKMLDVMREMDVHTFFYIGGNDSAFLR